MHSSASNAPASPSGSPAPPVFSGQSAEHYAMSPRMEVTTPYTNGEPCSGSGGGTVEVQHAGDFHDDNMAEKKAAPFRGYNSSPDAMMEELKLFSSRALQDGAEAWTAFKANIDLLTAAVAPYIQSHMIPLRSWTEFFVFVRPTADPHELQTLIEGNLQYYRANYLLIGVVIFTVAILIHPPWLLAVSLVIGTWASYLAKGGLNPSWKPVVGGVELTSSHRLMLLYAGSLALLFIVFGEALLALVGASAMLTMFHAGFHPGPVKGAAIASLQSMV